MAADNRQSNGNHQFEYRSVRRALDHTLLSSKEYHVVIVGASYAGLSAALTLMTLKDGQPLPLRDYGDYSHLHGTTQVKNLRITIIDERDGCFHTVGTPLAHISPAHTQRMWRQYKKFPKLRRPDVKVKHGTVTTIDPNNRILTYIDKCNNLKSQQPYDYLLVSTGIRRKWPVDLRAQSLIPHLRDASSHVDDMAAVEKLGIVVIGDGPVGIEFAGSLKAYHSSMRVTLVHSWDRLLSSEPLPDKFKTLSYELLQGEGVRVILNEHPSVEALPDGTYYVKSKNGDHIHAGLVIIATSQSKPSTSFLPKSYISGNGFIMVDSKLRTTGDPSYSSRIFAAGDIVEWPGIKLGCSAMIMGSVAAANIYALLLTEEDPSQPLVMERCPQHQPKIALSIGTNVVIYDGSEIGIQHGKDLAELSFGSDLGYSRFLSALGLEEYEE